MVGMGKGGFAFGYTDRDENEMIDGLFMCLRIERGPKNDLISLSFPLPAST